MDSSISTGPFVSAGAADFSVTGAVPRLKVMEASPRSKVPRRGSSTSSQESSFWFITAVARVMCSAGTPPSSRAFGSKLSARNGASAILILDDLQNALIDEQHVIGRIAFEDCHRPFNAPSAANIGTEQDDD